MKKYIVSAALIVVFVTPNVAMAAPGWNFWSSFWSWWQARSSRQLEPTVPAPAEVQNNVITTPNTQTPPTPINSAAPVAPSGVRSNTNAAIPAAPQIKVLSPNGGEIFTAGQKYEIKWTGAMHNVSVDVSNEKGVSIELAHQITNTGSYVWTIPTTLDTTSQYKIYVREGESGIGDASDSYFTISGASPSPAPIAPQNTTYVPSGSSVAVNLTSKPTSVNTPNSVDYIVAATAQFDKVVLRADCDGSLISISAKGGLFCGESVTLNISPTYQTSYPIIWSTKDGKNHLTGMTAMVYSNGVLIGTDRDAMTVIGTSQPDGALNVNFVNSTTNTSYGTYPLIITTDAMPRFVYPAGGETFVKTNSYMLKHLGGSGNAKIELINFSTGAATLVSASYPLSATTMSYVTFEFPSVIPAGTYYLKMSRTTDGTELAKSGTFTVADPEPAMGIVLPAGQRTFNPGQTIGLYYNGSNYPAGTTVDIKLGRRDLVVGSSIETLMTLATKQPMNATYNWTISTGLASRNDYVLLACPSTGGKCGYTNTFTVNPAPNATYTPSAAPATY